MTFATETYRKPFKSPWANEELILVVKRYKPQSSSPNGVTLLFFHCTGSHKEVWEPTIEHLFTTVRDPEGRPLIREAWSFDMHNHGEAAALNAEVLKERSTGLTVEECGEGVKAFSAEGNLNGHTLVGIGHSLGASALVLSTVCTEDIPGVNYQDIVLIEPALITRDDFNNNEEDRRGALQVMNAIVSKRVDEWSTRDDAREYFKARAPWKAWDSRVLELYVAHGLKEVIIQTDKPTSTKSIQLCCSKEHECRAYVQDEVYFRVIDIIKSLDPSVGVHYIYGETFDVIPGWVHQSVIDQTNPRSTQTVPETGHLTPHQSPEGVGDAIAQILYGTATCMAKL